MRLKDRSFPHPVLGNADDVSDSAFQTTFQVNNDKEKYSLIAEFRCSNSTLLRLLENGEASYVIHVECSNTFFRERFSTREKSMTSLIPVEDLNGRVEVNFFICAENELTDYVITGAHVDYEGAVFQIRKGEVLAIADAREFEATQDYDAIKSPSSIMQIQKSDEESGPMRVDWAAPKIRILLSKQDFHDYDQLKLHEAFRNTLTCGIVLPVLCQAIRYVQHDDENFRDLRWFTRLAERVTDSEFSNECEPLVLSQQILQMPLQRALKSSVAYLESCE